MIKKLLQKLKSLVPDSPSRPSTNSETAEARPADDSFRRFSSDYNKKRR